MVILPSPLSTIKEYWDSPPVRFRVISPTPALMLLLPKISPLILISPTPQSRSKSVSDELVTSIVPVPPSILDS